MNNKKGKPADLVSKEPENAATSQTPSPAKRSDWLWLAAILLVGLLLRGVYLHEIMQQPDFDHPAMDPQFNDYWARALVTGDYTPPEGYPDPFIRTTPHGRPPGYPYFLAAIYSVFGLNYTTPRIIQMALGLLNVILIFLLGRSIFNRSVGLVAAALMATYWVFIHFEGELTYPSVAVFLLLIFMLIIRSWSLKPTVARALLAGLAFGLFLLFRPNGALLVPVLCIWMMWLRGGIKTWRSVLPSAIAVCVGVVIPIAPPLIRNVVVAHDFVFLSSYGGVNLWVGNNPNADCMTPKIPDLEEIAGFEDWTCFHYPTIVRGLGRKLGKPDLKFSEASQYFYQQARSFMLHHPLKTLELTFKKFLVFWGPVETTNDKVLQWAKWKSPTLRWLPGFPWIAALFVSGCTVMLMDSCRRRQWVRGTWAMPGVMLLFIFGYCASVIPYFVAGRYRIPVIPFLILFGAYGLHAFWQGVRQKDYRVAATWSGVFLGSLALASIQFVAYTPDLAIWHHQRAIAFREKGDLDSAIAEVHKEIEANPRYADAYDFLGTLLAKSGRQEDALEAYQKALSIEPDNPTVINNIGHELDKLGRIDDALHYFQRAVEVNPQLPIARNNLGNALLGLGKPDEALVQYQEALRLDPADKFAQYNMGNALREMKEYGEAEKRYKAALQIDPRNPDIPNNLGLLYADQNRWKDAIGQYEAALKLNPDYANAYNNLGYAYSQEGQTDKAVELYEKAIRLNPKLALACNNLGNLYANLGKLDEAERQYRRALEIDPDDRKAEFNLGELFSRQQRWEEATQWYLKALVRKPSSPDVPNNLANALAKQGKFDEAIRYYGEALQIDPKYINAHLNLGTILAALNRPQDAVQHFRRAIEIDPNNALARDALNRLQNGGATR